MLYYLCRKGVDSEKKLASFQELAKQRYLTKAKELNFAKHRASYCQLCHKQGHNAVSATTVQTK